MSGLFDEQPEAVNPDELCRQAFSRCSNWPSDRAGQLGLAQGLKLASDRYHVKQEAIIARCREVSAFCPTDHDILGMAAELAGAQQRAAAPTMAEQRATLERECGPAQPFDWKALDKPRVDASKARERALWAALRRDPRARRGGQWESWDGLALLAEELGYHDYAQAWRR